MTPKRTAKIFCALMRWLKKNEIYSFYVILVEEEQNIHTNTHTHTQYGTYG